MQGLSNRHPGGLHLHLRGETERLLKKWWAEGLSGNLHRLGLHQLSLFLRKMGQSGSVWTTEGSMNWVKKMHFHCQKSAIVLMPYLDLFISQPWIWHQVIIRFLSLRRTSLKLPLWQNMLHWWFFIIFGGNLDEHLMRVRGVLDCLHMQINKVKPEKCHLLAKEVLFLGHILSGEVQPTLTGYWVGRSLNQPRKWDSFWEWPHIIADSLKTLRKLLALCQNWPVKVSSSVGVNSVKRPLIH